MIRVVLFFFFLCFVQCGGQLTDDQRKRLKEGMLLHELKKVSDVEITEAAFQIGRNASDSFEKNGADSLRDALQLKISRLHPGDSGLTSLEKQILDAYAEASETELFDNLQRLGSDSLLYTKPVLKKLPNGLNRLDYVLAIQIPKKSVILSIKD
jgi:hypothetical protein